MMGSQHRGSRIGVGRTEGCRGLIALCLSRSPVSLARLSSASEEDEAPLQGENAHLGVASVTLKDGVLVKLLVYCINTSILRCYTG